MKKKQGKTGMLVGMALLAMGLGQCARAQEGIVMLPKYSANDVAYTGQTLLETAPDWRIKRFNADGTQTTVATSNNPNGWNVVPRELNGQTYATLYVPGTAKLYGVDNYPYHQLLVKGVVYRGHWLCSIMYFGVTTAN